MRFAFSHEGEHGTVAVELGANRDPAALGCPDCALGFPVCEARISHPARGYAGALGWIQLTRSSEDEEGFALDPFSPLGPPSQPFCFFGFAPTLFDAPYRDDRPEMNWVAHSFLAAIGQPREVHSLLGFGWGFSIRAGAVAVDGPQELPASAWDEHRGYLGESFPAWSFAPSEAARPPRLEHPFSDADEALGG